MTKPEKTPTSGEQPAEEATLEETRAKEEQEFNSILCRMVRITGQISFYGSIFFLFVLPLFFFGQRIGESSVGSRLFGLGISLLFLAIPISAIVGLVANFFLWRVPTTSSDTKSFIVFTSIIHGCALLLFILIFPVVVLGLSV